MQSKYHNLQRGLGIIIWILVIALAWPLKWQAVQFYEKFIQAYFPNQSPYEWLNNRLEEAIYLTKPLDLEIMFTEPVWIRIGDKLRIRKKEEILEIGVVYALSFKYDNDPDWPSQTIVHTRVYPKYKSYISPDNTFFLEEEPISFYWIFNTLLPIDRRLEILKDLEIYLQANWPQMRDLFIPLLIEIFQESYKIFQKNFPIFLESNKEKIIQHFKRLKIHYLQKDILPLVEEAFWPIVAAECQKELQPIVEELWSKLPKGELLWLYFYQKLPGVEKDHIRTRLEKFFKAEAIPILKKYQDQIEKIPLHIIEKISMDEKIKKALREIIQKFLDEQEFHNFVKDLIVQFYKQNDLEIQKQIRAKIYSPEFQKKCLELIQRLEPYLVKIANRIVLKSNSREISSELAQVLRRQILNKDRYFLYTTPTQQLNNNPPRKFLGKKQ